MTDTEKWEAIKEHFKYLRFEKVPPPHVIHEVYADIQKFNQNFLRLLEKDPTLAEKTLASVAKKKIFRHKPDIKLLK